MELSRRELLLGTGKIVLGAAVAGAAGGAIIAGASEGQKTSGPVYPWPYKPIDPQRAADIAYEAWYQNFCCFAAASGIMVPLRESVGEPYTSFPIISLKFGEGGIEGWGTICGTLMGASLALSLAAGPDSKPMINDLMDWYSTTMMPSYEPKNPKALFKQKTVSDSPLCHISVGKWMKAENKPLGSPERRDRCARLAASVAQKSALMLNDWAAGKYVPAYKGKQSACGITSQNNCTDCHGNNIPNPIQS